CIAVFAIATPVWTELRTMLLASFSLTPHGPHRHLPSFPTRRSSDLVNYHLTFERKRRWRLTFTGRQRGSCWPTATEVIPAARRRTHSRPLKPPAWREPTVLKSIST